MTNKYPTALELLQKEGDVLNTEYASLQKEWEKSTDPEDRKAIRAHQGRLKTKINRLTGELLNQDRLTQ